MTTPSIHDLRALQTTLNATIDAYSTSPTPEKAAPINKAAKALAAATRGTSTDFIGLAFQPLENMVIRIAIDLDLFTLIEENVSLEDLARKTGADANLLHRILRLLVATKVVLEPQQKVYSATPLSHMFRTAPIRDWMKTTFDTLLPIWSTIPAWLRENGYKDITSLENNPTRTLYGENFFDALAKDATREADFASAMSLQDIIPAIATAQFPWGEAGASFDEAVSDVFIVDVGGGAGQYLARVLGEHPGLPGRKVLQDLPTVIAPLQSAEGSALPFEPQPHNFLTPQPVKAARYYHLRGVLHDWPDASCLTILQHIKDACKPGYSEILIHTVILPETGVGRSDAANDLCMWTVCGKERTRGDWDVLLGEVGLRVERVYLPQAGFMGYMVVKVV